MHPIISNTLCALVAAGVATPAVAASDYFLKLGDIKASATSAGGGKHLEIESYAWGTTSAKGNVEFEWKVEEGESAPPVGGSEKLTVGGGRTEASGQATGKRQHKPLRTRAYVDQSTAPAEKRQHGWTTVSKPLDRGAVRVKVKFPWDGCKVGARYPEMTLGGGAQRYELKDAIVTSCGSASSGGESLPLEEVSFNYGKIQVRGWDPDKKQE